MSFNKSTKKNLISVIMPAYNSENYIAEAIDSIIAQTYPNWELIIINDCSTDGTADIAEGYAKKDRRIRLIHNKRNSKQWFSRNVGLAAARGDYIAWMDSDDISTPDRLEKQMDFLKKNKKADMVGTAVKFIDEQGKMVMNESIKKIDDWFAKEHHLNKRGLRPAYVGASFLFKKTILQKITQPYFRPLALAEDLDLPLRLMEKGVQVFNLGDKLYFNRLHGAQSTRNDFFVRLSAGLVRYGAGCRRGGDPDPLVPLIRKYGEINKTTMVPVFVSILRDKTFPTPRALVFEAIDRLFLHCPYFTAAKGVLVYRPSLFLLAMMRSLVFWPYYALPILRRPLHQLRTIIGKNKEKSHRGGQANDG